MSELAEASRSSEGWNCTALTGPVCLSSVHTSLPVSSAHNCTVQQHPTYCSMLLHHIIQLNFTPSAQLGVLKSAIFYTLLTGLLFGPGQFLGSAILLGHSQKFVLGGIIFFFWGGGYWIAVLMLFLPHKKFTWADFGGIYPDIPPPPVATPLPFW